MRQQKRNLTAVALVATALLCAASPAVAETPVLETAVTFGGSLGDRGNDIAIDGGGNVYVTGFFSDTVDFDPGPGVAEVTAAGLNDAFVCKFDSSGSLTWVRTMGGSGSDISYGIGLDGAGGVYLTGYFQGTADFDPGVGVANLVSAGDDDIFVCKLNTDGDFVWARRAGSTGIDRSSTLAMDTSGNVYVTGRFRGTVDFDPSSGTHNMTASASGNAFVWKLDSGGALVYARNMGGSAEDYGQGIAVDAAGAVYVVGQFNGTGDYDPGPATFNLSSAGANDAFICKLDANGDFVWAGSIGGAGDDRLFGVVPDGVGGTYVTGHFSGSVDLDPGSGTLPATAVGGVDAFVLRLDAAGDGTWAKAFGGSGDDRGFALSVESSGDILVTGFFEDAVDLGDPSANLSSSEGQDAFLLKLTSGGTPVWSVSLGGDLAAPTPTIAAEEGRSVAVDALGRAVFTGGYGNEANLASAGGTGTITSNGERDVFLLWLNLVPDGGGEGEPGPPSPAMPVAGWPALLALAVLGVASVRKRR